MQWCMCITLLLTQTCMNVDPSMSVFADFEYFIFDELSDNFSRFYGFNLQDLVI